MEEIIEVDLTGKQLYIVDELKALNIDEKVIISYQDDDCKLVCEARVIDSDSNNIYFEFGYDFPLSDTEDVELPFAIEDSGDHVFKVYKV